MRRIDKDGDICLRLDGLANGVRIVDAAIAPSTLSSHMGKRIPQPADIVFRSRSGIPLDDQHRPL